MSKWKSLDEARRLAKECRSKGDESKDFKSVEERFSELESFMTRKGEESLSSIRREPFQDRLQPKEKTPEKTKKNIMKLLEELEDGESRD